MSYVSVHFAIRKLRGPASSYLCDYCAAPAHQWAYDHTDPFPLISPRGVKYSADLERYDPLCMKCHRTRDSTRFVCWPVPTPLCAKGTCSFCSRAIHRKTKWQIANKLGLPITAVWMPHYPEKRLRSLPR